MISRRSVLNNIVPNECLSKCAQNKCVQSKCAQNKCVQNKCVQSKCVQQKPASPTGSRPPPKLLLLYINKVNNDILEAKGPVITDKGHYLDFEKDYISFLTK